MPWPWGLAATIHVWGGISFSMLFQQISRGSTALRFIAVPMFILAGELMSRVGIIDDILLLCRVVMGWVPGSLANANIVASMFLPACPAPRWRHLGYRRRSDPGHGQGGV